ncbi:hypothetical protein H2C68_22840 [Vibrio alginolyticus]|uniref:hypothetical protein n=1 Tax=Vibrio alginolyticus TaxID=663 RepID=UPI002119FD8D|nr:hypothetical protein [Vibrio alginolyticus]MCQ9039804.1 hypothetical protein [Vibrio alginolyticus]
MRVQQSKIGTDPVKYYASLIGMEKHESRLKKQTNAIPIMTGIVLYRQLPKNKQSQILKQILDMSDNQLKASEQLKKTVTSSPVAQVGMKMGLTKQTASRASAILVVMVTVIAYQTSSNAKDAQKELLRRGLLKADDL